MADHYQKEDASGNYQLEDGTGAYLLEAGATFNPGWAIQSTQMVGAGVIGAA